MRLVIAGMLAGTFFAAALQAEDGPQAPVAAQTSEAAVSPDEALSATGAESAEAAKDRVEAAPSEAAMAPAAAEGAEQAREHAGATGEATAAGTAAAEAADSASAMAERERIEDENFRRMGYKPTTVTGEKKYCKKVQTPGTRLQTGWACWTSSQIKAEQSESQKQMREKGGKRSTDEG